MLVRMSIQACVTTNCFSGYKRFSDLVPINLGY